MTLQYKLLLMSDHFWHMPEQTLSCIDMFKHSSFLIPHSASLDLIVASIISHYSYAFFLLNTLQFVEKQKQYKVRQK